MVFASSIFLYCFLPVFLGLYYLTPRGWRSVTLALASYLFYGWWRPDFVALMLISTAVDYTAGRRITAARRTAHESSGEGPRPGKRWLVLSCVVNLGLLAYFKYAGFGVETLNSLLGQLGFEAYVVPGYGTDPDGGSHDMTKLVFTL